MDEGFQAAYKQLNAKQREAVDIIDGPVLVIAGPGTGKTQLLSMRVANIIRQSDTAPGNILCLTFTDNAARNMRERLETVIGQPAYHVAIHTFHSFGGDIINQYADFFTERPLLQQIDELGRYELLREIFEHLPHSDPLSTKAGEDFVHIRSVLTVISWLKQNALTPAEVHEIVAANQKFMDALAPEIAEMFAATPSPKQLDLYASLLAAIEKHETGKRYFGFPEYAAECAAELRIAIDNTSDSGRFAPLITAWRNKWCVKDAQNRHVFKDAGQNIRKMHSVARVYGRLLDSMAEQGLYDFDDMIMEVVHALETNKELRYTLQERYQYVLVDEFQDTNKAQLRMLTALGDNPVNEGQPNIMAVGDDDQAIYAFQGAEVSNMVAFATQYPATNRITLEDNYRSTARILEASFAVANQITDRLQSILPDTHKTLTPRATHQTDILQHSVFSSELAQYDWIAEQIGESLKQGLKPEEIAVIAPRHRYLERLTPYLAQRGIPVAYERRENILDAPIVIQLVTMTRLVVAIDANQHDEVDALMSRVLSYEFWEIPASTLMEISLQCYNKHEHWLPMLADHEDEKLRDIAAWFIGLARNCSLEPLEYVLDELMGGLAAGKESDYDDILLPGAPKPAFVSPMRRHTFNAERYEVETDEYLALLGQLSTLRQRLRYWKPNRMLFAKDLVEFVELHAHAGLKIVDTNPHTQTTNAVQVMTAYKAKGLEFEVVFAINAQDEVWGPTARSGNSSITLPRNLPLAPSSDGDNDKLRLLFVALTRAKSTLHVTGYTHDMDNKLSPALSFIGGSEAAGPLAVFTPKIIDKPASAEAAKILTTDWVYRFRQVIADKPTLFEPILKSYKLSVTHLNNFLDVANAGPEYFLMHNLLRFPSAQSPPAAYGDAVHKTLQWAHSELRKSGKLPSTTATNAYFDDILSRKHLRKSDYTRLSERGGAALKLYFAERGGELTAGDIIERGFNNEGVVVAGAHLSGKIDKIRLGGDGSASVIDFKTGKPAKSWQGNDEYERLKLHKYRQQLLFYKLLIENSATYSRKLVASSGALEFVEADAQGKLVGNLEMSFSEEELQRFVKLVSAVWEHVMRLDFPDVSGYSPSNRGVAQFEQDLIDGNI